MNRRWSAVLLLLLGAAVGFGARLDDIALRDSMMSTRPRVGRDWLERDLFGERLQPQDWSPSQDSGLRIVGRWSYGPSQWVDLKATSDDTIVFLSRGSGVSIIRFRSQDSLQLNLLADINSCGLTGRCQVRDTLLYVNSRGVECYNVSDLSSPVLLNWLSQPLIYDFYVVDTLLYISGRDSLRIFSVANPASPRWVGACADSGYSVTVSGSYCYLGIRDGVSIVDVSDPAYPHRVATIGSFEPFGITVRDTLCFVGIYTDEVALRVYNVKNTATPFLLGELAGVEARDICLPPTCDTVLYTPKLHVINITDPANPRQIGYVNCPGWDYRVVAVPALNYALVADYFDGLAVVDIQTPPAPAVDSTSFGADLAEDISVQNNLAAVADHGSGLILLDVSDPTRPSFLGRYDTSGFLPQMKCAVLADSFAYVSWPVERLQSVDISDPRRPVRAGVCTGMHAPPGDMVLRDSLLYCAMIRRLQIVNVARPRQPVLVGSCVAGDATEPGIYLADTLAYVTNAPTQVINVVDPQHPVVIGEFGRGAWNVCVRDTFAYLATISGVFIYSVADAAAPRLLDSMDLGTGVYDFALTGSFMYAGCGDGVRLLSLDDPVRPVVRGFVSTTYLAMRVNFSPPHLYATASLHGISVIESTHVGIAEPGATAYRRGGCSAFPNPTTGTISLRCGGRQRAAGEIRVTDAAGRLVIMSTTPADGHPVTLDLTPLPPGVYFVRTRTDAWTETAKVCRQNGRSR